MSSPLRIGILGTGGMADQHALSLAKLRDRCEVVAGCDVDSTRLNAFCTKHKVPQAYASLDAMLETARLDAIFNVTPDRFHAPLTLQAIEHGLHVFCEKPLAETYADAARMRDAAVAAGVVNMVDFTYRNMPAIQTARELVQSGEIGEPRHLEASYLQSWLVADYWGDWRTSPQWLWRLSSAHGSKGVLGDTGVHIVDFASFPVGAIATVQCRLKTFPKAKGDRIDDYHLDANDSAAITVEFENGALGIIHASRWATGFQNRLDLMIHGDRGALRIDLEKSENTLELCAGKDANTQTWRKLHCDPKPDIWERFLDAIEHGSNGEPDFARGAEIQQVLDACFAAHESGGTIAI